MKRNRIKYIILLLLTIWSTSSMWSQDESNPAIMDKKVWQEETKKVDYGDIEYEKEEEEVEPEVENTTTTIEEEEESKSWDIGFVQAIVFGLVILIVLYILYLIFGNMVFQNKRIDRDGRSYTLEEIEEDLEQADLDTHIEQSLSAADYKKAIRLHYLKIIKELSLKDWIEWQKDKTNFTYVFEMQNREEFRSFRDLTVAFEIVWYGEVEILKEHFERLDPIFSGFLNNLHRR